MCYAAENLYFVFCTVFFAAHETLNVTLRTLCSWYVLTPNFFRSRHIENVTTFFFNCSLSRFSRQTKTLLFPLKNESLCPLSVLYVPLSAFGLRKLFFSRFAL